MASARWLKRFADLSTSVKLLVFILVALAPLGLIAILATMESIRANQVTRQGAARAAAIEAAQGVDALIVRTTLGLRAAGTALERASGEECRRTLASFAGSSRPGEQFAFLREGRRLCASAAFRPFVATVTPGQTQARLDDGSLTVTTRSDSGRISGTARFDASSIAAEVAARGIPPGDYRLVQGRSVLPLPAAGGVAAAFGIERIVVPVAGHHLSLELRRPVPRMTVTEGLGILLPVLMLVAAATIAFLVVDRTILIPLRQLQGAVLTYRTGDRTLRIPPVTTPAHEIRTLADSFRQVTETIVRHEQELEEGLVRQTRLTREVHHRVKNNLQVVASLLNLHARGAQGPEVAAAYAAIQRRVDALAVVHRNHYAELEDNRGLALRPLIGELAANLRAAAPVEAAAMPILLDLAPLYATQDTAVPVAFLVTELVEAAMLHAPRGRVTVTLAADTPGRAVLAVIAPGLADHAGKEDTRFERVLTGLSRQLRATLDRDEATGRFAIGIGVV